MRSLFAFLFGSLLWTASTLYAAPPPQTEEPVQEEEVAQEVDPWSAAGMAGIWDFTIDPDGKEPFVASMTLTFAKDVLGGSVNLGADMPMSNLTWDAKTGAFACAIEMGQGFALEITMTRDGDQLKGILSDGQEVVEGAEDAVLRETIVAKKNLAKTKAAAERAAAIARGEVVDGVEVNDRALNIKGKDLKGVDFQLADYKGKVIMLDFWGDW